MHNEKTNPIGLWIAVGLITLCQIVAVASQWMIYSSLNADKLLAGAFALMIGTGLSFFLSLVLTLSPTGIKAARVLSKSAGGVLAIVGMIILLGVVYTEQPVLAANGYRPAESILVTFVAQLPLALSSSAFTARTLSDLMADETYSVYMDALSRRHKVIRNLMAIALIQRAILDVREVAQEYGVDNMVSPYLAQPELRAVNLSRQLPNRMRRSLNYIPDEQYGTVLEELSRKTAALPMAQVIEPAKTEAFSWDD